MELDERKKQVLHAVIKRYILTGEPVGSRTISKESNLGVSSATIRNEMSDLEEMGYLVQPHTSAGRIPADLGYRLYVNQILSGVNEEIYHASRLIDLANFEINHLEGLLQEAARILSTCTSYTAIVISPDFDTPKIKKVQLILIDKDRIMILLISDTKVIQSDVFSLKSEITEEEIGIINNFLNTRLQGKKIGELSLDMIKEDTGRMSNNEIVEQIVPLIIGTAEVQKKKDIYFEGVTNALEFIDFEDIDRAKRFFDFVEDKERVVNLLCEGIDSDIDSGVEFTIGSENKDEEMQDLTLVKSVYKVGGETVGKMGLVGPTRMDYEKVMVLLKTLTDDLSRIIKTYLK